MYTAMLSVENILQGAHHDIWAVNVEEEYHEEKASSPGAGTGRSAPVVPRRVLGRNARQMSDCAVRRADERVNGPPVP